MVDTIGRIDPERVAKALKTIEREKSNDKTEKERTGAA